MKAMRSPKHLACLVLVLHVSARAVSAQDIGPTPPPSSPPLPLPTPGPQTPAGPTEDAIVRSLKAVWIYESTNHVVPNDADLVKFAALTNASGLIVDGPDFLRESQGELLAEVVREFLGRGLGTTSLRRMETNIVRFCRQKDHWVVDVIYPYDQNLDAVEAGVIQIVVMEGRVGNVAVKNEGRQWFSTNVIRRNVRVKEGDVVLGSRLVKDLNWLRRNDFFRSVSASFQQAPTVGGVDLTLSVRDRFPLQVFAGYDDAGNDVLGNDRFLAGFNWGNAFGLDHQLSYQFTSDVEFQYLLSHAGSYVAPLPWHHSLTLFGYYADLQGNLETFGFSGLTQDGSSLQGSVRYDVPLPTLRSYYHEISLGGDFKQSDNDLLFGGEDFYSTPTEILQFGGGYRGILYDPLGQTGFEIQGAYSPGGLTDKNDDAAFDLARPGATADYYYLQLRADRVTRLPFQKGWRYRDPRELFTWVVRGAFQHTGDRLLPSEQWALGGYATVRGYDERIVNGDRGWLVSTEIRSPEFRISNLLGRHDAQQPTGGRGDRLQVLVFFDYGHAEINNLQPTESVSSYDMYSVGVGLRWRISTVFSLRFDYGLQLNDLSEFFPSATDNSRMHIGLTASY